jgi:hypothetical protein
MNYAQIVTILRAAEQTLIGVKSIEVNRRGIRGYFDTVLVAPWLVMAGARLLGWRLVWVLIAGVTFTIVLMVLGGGQLRQVLGPSFVLGLGAVYFSAPSRSLTANVKAENITTVRERILEFAESDRDVQYLHEGVMVVRAHSMEKLGRFSVLIGIGWAVLFWYASSHTLAPGLSPQVISRSLSFGLAGLLIFAIVLFIGTCYATAVRAIFQLLEIAFLEAKSTITN